MGKDVSYLIFAHRAHTLPAFEHVAWLKRMLIEIKKKMKCRWKVSTDNRMFDNFETSTRGERCCYIERIGQQSHVIGINFDSIPILLIIRCSNNSSINFITLLLNQRFASITTPLTNFIGATAAFPVHSFNSQYGDNDDLYLYGVALYLKAPPLVLQVLRNLRN